jgi:flagellar hook-basal body complex protein FliE
MPIDQIGTTRIGGTALGTVKTAAVGAPDASTFTESLSKLIENVEQSGLDANRAVNNMVDKNGDVHEAMIALQKAEMALQLTVQVRNKFVQAYQDIMRMPI